MDLPRLVGMNHLASQVTNLRKVNSSVKLLALNARIESVRDGEIGLAFYIFAQEMMDFSSRTAGISDDLVNRTRSHQEIGIPNRGILGFKTVLSRCERTDSRFRKRNGFRKKSIAA